MGKNKERPRATFSGEIKIGDIKIPCYVLENGERIISTRGIMRSIGRVWRGRKYAGTHYPVFIEAKNLKPFISRELDAVLNPLVFKTDKGIISEGFKAEVLPMVCETYLKAKDENKLTPAQERIAKKCEILVRGFAQVGIIALVDEATGYQEVRARKALEEILDKFIAKELRKWAKTFPDEFYEQMFKLRGWQYVPFSVKRPGVVGKYTNDLVYERLAPGVLEELKRLTPRDEKGRTKHRYFQRLTEDVGHPRLREHLTAVIALMKASTKWGQFYRLIQRALPKYGEQMHLPLKEPED